CVPVGGGGGGGGTPTDPMGTGVPTNGTIRVDFSVFLAGGVNDVATGPDGSIWTIGNGTTVCAAACTRTVTFGKGGQRLVVDQFGLPWIVGFDFTIWRGNADGSMTQMPGAANDIGISASGDVWVIGTNRRNDSFQVYHLVNGGWVADPGSGQAIDVD